MFGSSDPYVKFTVNEEGCPWVQSERRNSTLNPEWDDGVPAPEFELPVGDVTKASLKLLVFDHDGTTGDDELCSGTQPLLPFRGESGFLPAQLELKSGTSKGGTLTIAIRFEQH